MVEFLVAAFVFAVGVLGLTALQLAAMRQSTTGRGRVTATYVAEQAIQMIQVAGQRSYSEKVKNPAFAPPEVFFQAPGTEIALRSIAGFNVDGIQVSLADATTGVLTNVADLETRIPDLSRRNPIYTVQWARRAYLGEAPASGAHVQEYVVNVEWVEDSVTRYLSMSRNIRY